MSLKTIVDFMLLSASLTNLFLGLFILLYNAKNSINKRFFLFSFLIFLWVLGIFIFQIQPILFWGKYFHLIALFLPLAFNSFVNVFPYRDLKTEIEYNLLIVFLLTLPLTFMIVNNQVLKGIIDIEVGKGFDLGAYYLLYLVYFIFSMGLGFFNLSRKYKKSTGLQKLQIKYIFIGFFIVSSIGIYTCIFLPFIGIAKYYYLGPISSISVVVFTAYAITRTQLMDIKLIITRGMAFFILFLIYTVFGLISVYLFSQFFVFGINLPFLIYLIFLLFCSGLLFHPLRLLIQTTPDKFIFRKKYLYDKTLDELGKAYTETSDLKEIIKTSKQRLSETMRTKKVNLWLAGFDGDYKQTE